MFLRYSTCTYTGILKPGLGSLKVIKTDTDRSATYDFLLTFHCNQGPISYRFRDKRRFQSKIANFPDPVYFTTPVNQLIKTKFLFQKLVRSLLSEHTINRVSNKDFNSKFTIYNFRVCSFAPALYNVKSTKIFPYDQ